MFVVKTANSVNGFTDSGQLIRNLSGFTSYDGTRTIAPKLDATDRKALASPVSGKDSAEKLGTTGAKIRKVHAA